MKITGTLSYTDLGVGVWHLETNDTKYKLYVDSQQASTFVAGQDVTLEVEFVSENVQDNAMTGTRHAKVIG